MNSRGHGEAAEPAAPDAEARFGPVIGWSTAWLLSYIAVTVMFKTHTLLPGGVSWLVAVAPSALGVVAIGSYLRYLYGCTSERRRAHLLALALGFCGGAFTMLGWRLLVRAGAPPLDFNDPFVAMVALWAVGLLAGRRRG